MFVIWKIWSALFACYLRFKIRSFTLSPKIYLFMCVLTVDSNETILSHMSPLYYS